MGEVDVSGQGVLLHCWLWPVLRGKSSGAGGGRNEEGLFGDSIAFEPSLC